MLTCDPDGIIAPCVRFLKSSLGEELGDFALGTIQDGIGIKKDDLKTQRKEFSKWIKYN